MRGAAENNCAAVQMEQVAEKSARKKTKFYDDSLQYVTKLNFCSVIL